MTSCKVGPMTGPGELVFSCLRKKIIHLFYLLFYTLKIILSHLPPHAPTITPCVMPVLNAGIVVLICEFSLGQERTTWELMQSCEIRIRQSLYKILCNRG